MYYGLHYIPSRSVDEPRFMPTATPQGLSDPVLPADWKTWDQVAADLRSVDTDEKLIEEARKKALEKVEAFSIPPMFLTDEQLGRLGFGRK